MKKNNTPLLYISLAVGILFILMGLVLLLLISANPDEIVFSRTALVLLIAGASFLFFSLAFSHRAYHFYIGLNLSFWGILSIALALGLFNLTLDKIWPVGMIFCGVSLIPAGYYGYHRLRTAYIFPSVLIIILGILFSLFSFDIIPVSLARLAAQWWPVFLILLGCVLIGIFQFQRTNKNTFPYMPDDEEAGDDL